MLLIVLQRIALQFILDILYFPLWWYSGGVVQTLNFCSTHIKMFNANLAPWLWFKNMFVPMYGQYDWQGRLMSFFIRIVNVFARSIALVLFLFLMFLLFIFYLLIPIFLTIGAVRSLVV